ncbi:TPA: aromatic-ring-hydroxylating dioxygenase subunit beta [Burkholderia cenocepacia]|nr:aromatic-ring-hydroxylating dioxygenase subunit beta [Burkholderia cenocepacia]
MLLDRSFDVSIAPVSRKASDIQLQFEVEQFLYREAGLLDERAFDEWLALWTEEGRYWVPRHPDQNNPFEQISLFWEDHTLRSTRVHRLLNNRNWSQQPATRTSRIVGNVRIEGCDRQDQLIVSSRLQVSEYRLELRNLSARVVHKLSKSDGDWRIALKRVDLVNCESVFSNIEVFL